MLIALFVDTSPVLCEKVVNASDVPAGDLVTLKRKISCVHRGKVLVGIAYLVIRFHLVLPNVVYSLQEGLRFFQCLSV